MLYTIQKKEKNSLHFKKKTQKPTWSPQAWPTPLTSFLLLSLPQPCSAPWPPPAQHYKLFPTSLPLPGTLPYPRLCPLSTQRLLQEETFLTTLCQPARTHPQQSLPFFNRIIITLNSLNTLTSHCLSLLRRPKFPEGRDTVSPAFQHCLAPGEIQNKLFVEGSRQGWRGHRLLKNNKF